MSNRASIALTKTYDLKKDGSVSRASYGLRVYDDYASTSARIRVKSEEQILSMTDKELLEMAANLNDTAAIIIEDARENLEGIEIRGEWTTWKQLGLGGPSA